MMVTPKQIIALADLLKQRGYESGNGLGPVMMLGTSGDGSRGLWVTIADPEYPNEPLLFLWNGVNAPLSS